MVSKVFEKMMDEYINDPDFCIPHEMTIENEREMYMPYIDEIKNEHKRAADAFEYIIKNNLNNDFFKNLIKIHLDNSKDLSNKQKDCLFKKVAEHQTIVKLLDNKKNERNFTNDVLTAKYASIGIKYRPLSDKLLNSLTKFFQERGFLTPKQRALLGMK